MTDRREVFFSLIRFVLKTSLKKIVKHKTWQYNVWILILTLQKAF